MTNITKQDIRGLCNEILASRRSLSQAMEILESIDLSGDPATEKLRRYWVGSLPAYPLNDRILDDHQATMRLELEMLL